MSTGSEPPAAVEVTPRYTVQTLEQVTRAHLVHALELFSWNLTRAAEAIEVDRRTLYRMIERLKIERPAAVPPPTRNECVTCGKLAPESDQPAQPGMAWFCSPACSRAPRVEAAP